MNFDEYRFEEVIVNYDRLRVPLSSMQRKEKQGVYRYYGAQGVIDHIDEYIFDGEYLLIAEDGENLKSKKQNIAQVAKGKFWVNNHAHILQTNSKCELRYLYYLINSMDLSGYITGSAQPKLSQANMNKIPLIIPSIDEQNKILAIVGTIDDKIEVNNEINKNLLEQAQAILTSFFIDFSQFGGTVPDDWKQGTLQDIANFSNGYAFKSKELLNTSEPNCYQVFKQGHINRGGGFNSSGTKSWYPISKSSALSKYVLHKGDVLMAMTDMKDNVAILGNTALMAVDDQYIVNQRVGLLRSNGYKSTSYAYIYLLTNSLKFLKDLRSRANSGVQVNLSSNEIKDSSVWIANDEVNEEFNALTEPLLSMIMTNDIENQKLIDLRDTLLPKLMSGELDVSNLNL